MKKVTTQLTLTKAELQKTTTKAQSAKTQFAVRGFLFWDPLSAPALPFSYNVTA